MKQCLMQTFSSEKGYNYSRFRLSNLILRNAVGSDEKVTCATPFAANYL